MVGLSVLAAGCDRKLPIIPTPLATPAQPKRAAPTPLEPAGVPTSPALWVGATFGKSVALEGVTLDQESARAGEYLRLWLHWQSIAPAAEDLRSIGRLVTPQGRVLGSEDDQIGGRRRHLTRWQVGERCVDEMRLRILPSASPGEYGLVIGVLRPDNQTAVPVTTRPQAAASWHEDAVLVAMVEVSAG
ncbi:MAG: hypothetical protein IT306_27285 [Chloroflexi bacterium]|nr:hypothetical protein [Chloroflexota bacterium]